MQRRTGVVRVGFEPLLQLSLLFSLFLWAPCLRAQEDDGAALDPEQAEQLTLRADGLARGLCNPLQSFASLDRLMRDYRFRQSLWTVLAPPTTNAYCFRCDRLRVFNPTGFPTQVISGLIPESYRDIAIVYRITIGEDPQTRDRVLFNANGQEIWRQAPPENYDPWRYLRATRPWALTLNTPAALRLRVMYDPSRIWFDYILLPIDSVPDYAAAIAYISITNQVANAAANDALAATRQSMMGLQTAAPVTTPTITGIAVGTNMVHMNIALPDPFSSPLGLLTRTTLVSGRWSSLGGTNMVSAFTWDYPRNTNETCRFYTIADLGPDSDGDGLPDALETMVYGSNPLAWSTTTNGIPDGWAVANGFNPLDSSVASGDADHDGLTNLQEYLLGTDPWNPDVTPPIISIMTPAVGAREEVLP